MYFAKHDNIKLCKSIPQEKRKVKLCKIELTFCEEIGIINTIRVGKVREK